MQRRILTKYAQENEQLAQYQHRILSLVLDALDGMLHGNLSRKQVGLAGQVSGSNRPSGRQAPIRQHGRIFNKPTYTYTPVVAEQSWTGCVYSYCVVKLKNVSCEIEDFVETHVFKLRGMLRSRVLRFLCDIHHGIN